MIDLLIVANNRANFSDFSDALSTNNEVSVAWAVSGADALSIATRNRFDLVVADETLGDMSGLVLAEKLVTQNPMVNCAVVSPLPEKEFHEASEGLGLLAKLPHKPGAQDARNLMKQLRLIKGMVSGDKG